MEEKILFKVSPKFKMIYELFMPTGKKMKNTLIFLISIIVFYIIANLISSNVVVDNKEALNIVTVLNNITIILIILLLLKLAIHITIQVLQYKNITYTFYTDYLEYKDTFLNQHTKTLRYDNIKEIEIRRTVLDRIMGYGVIVVYSNAEKGPGSGLVIFSIKDPQFVYDQIDSIIHRKNIKNENNEELLKKENTIVENVNNSNITPEEIIEDEKEFKDSLQNK